MTLTFFLLLSSSMLRIPRDTEAQHSWRDKNIILQEGTKMAKTDLTLLDRLGQTGCIREFLSEVFPAVNFPTDKENHSVLCPFHDDHKASCSVNVRLGCFKCHSCDEKGTMFKFRAKVEKLSEQEARKRFVEELNDHRVQTGDQGEVSVDARKNGTKDLPSAEDIKRMSSDLLTNPNYVSVLERLHSRGIKDDVIAKLSLGADVDSFEHGKFTGPCLVIPVFDETREHVLTLKKLLYQNGERYFNTCGKAKRLYNVHHLSQNPAALVFVTEGELDAIRLMQEGLIAVTTVGGATCWDENWAKYFKGREVVVLYDSDKAGRKGAQKVLMSLRGVVKTLRDVDLFPGTEKNDQKDITDFFLLGKTKEEFLNVVMESPIIVDPIPSEGPEVERSLRDQFRAMDKPSSELLGESTFHWITEHGGKFLKDADHTLYVLDRKKQMRIDDKDPVFESYLYDLTGLTTVIIKGKVIVKVLRALAEKHGMSIQGHSFLYSSVAEHTVYLNPSNSRGELVEISPGHVKLIENGVNERGVFLSSTEALRPFNVVELTTDEMKSALANLEQLVINNLACSPDNRMFVTAWILCFPYKDFVKTRPIMRFEGDSLSGKSTAMEILSSLILGVDQKSLNTAASMYSEGSKVPILFLDNIERRNLRGEIFDFFLTSATGVSKKKRKMGTDTEIVTERVRCLVCMNGIENLFGWELINRTYVVDFNRKHQGTTFSDDLFADIIRERDGMLSAMCQLYARILSRIKDGSWKKHKLMLAREYPRHSKERTNSYLSLMLLFVEEFCAAAGSPLDTGRLVAQWVKAQEKVSTATGIDSDVIVQYLEHLINRIRNYWVDRDGHPWPFPIVCPKIINMSVTFECFAIELHTTFKEILKGLTPPYAFKDARQLGRRLSDSRGILEKAGWHVHEIHKRKGRAVWEFKYVPSISETEDGSQADGAEGELN